ncbi:MAG: hypothetical protein OHK0013_37720 [Sandaracinaceae bacterium]
MRRLLLVVAWALLVAVAWAAPSESVEADRQAASHRRGRRVRRAPPPRLTAAQRRQIRRWHARPSRTEVQVWLRRDPPPLVFRALHLPQRFELVPASREGGFDEEDLALAQRAFAYRQDGTEHPVHPRLLELVYRAVRHFRAPYVTVVSGYRSGNPRSRHGQGRAIDLVLPGVSDRRLAAYLRPQGFVGVGIYPNSGFVHLDVRARSYFWSDASGPGQPNRERQILRALGPRFDRIARALGAEPTVDHPDAPEIESSTEGSLGEQEAVSVEARATDAVADFAHTHPPSAAAASSEPAYAPQMTEPKKEPKKLTLTDDDISLTRAAHRPGSLQNVGNPAGTVKQIANDPLTPRERQGDPDAS